MLMTWVSLLRQMDQHFSCSNSKGRRGFQERVLCILGLIGKCWHFWMASKRAQDKECPHNIIHIMAYRMSWAKSGSCDCPFDTMSLCFLWNFSPLNLWWPEGMFDDKVSWCFLKCSIAWLHVCLSLLLILSLNFFLHFVSDLNKQ